MTQCVFPLVRQLLVARLQARGGLAGVNVQYQAPETSGDVRGDTGVWESLFLAGDPEGDSGIEVFTDLTDHHWTDDFAMDVVAQVLGPSSTQEAVEERCGEIIAEVLAEVGSSAWVTAVNTGLPDFDYVIVTPVRQRWVPGYLPGTTGGHAIRCELSLQVRARRAYS